jgi:Amt family ammonium transporter
MTTALQTPQRRSRSKLQDASLVNGPMLLLRSIRGFSSNRSMLWLATVPLALFGLGIFNLSAHASDFPELNAAFLANNLWLLIATILVIFMNAGFAMVEAGMCRSKNAVNILAKNLFVFALAVTAYWFVGYKIMYGDSVLGGWFFWGGFFFDPEVTAEMVTDGSLVPTVDFLFQSAFAGTAATIVSGLVAERVKFGEFVVFALVLTAVIYPIAGSWEWNGGWLNSVPGAPEFIDFAGSSIVHSVGAWAGLVGAMLLGPRIGKFVDGKPQAMPGHNMAIATLGALILWIGWYGFNPGSQLAMDQWVPYVAVTTTLAAAGGGIAATILSTLTSGKPDLTMIINGILAGLVSITAGCGNLTMVGSWIAGFIGGIIVVFSVAALDAAEIDDPVGAFSVHGVCGVWGTVVIGLWGYDIQGSGAGLGLFNGGGIGQ